MDAIEMMMSGKATGKGLNVKGKSAKKGKLSGFVPFLQICEEEHKKQVSTCPPDTVVRVFYATQALRDAAMKALQSTLAEMAMRVVEAAKALQAENAEETIGRRAYLDHVEALNTCVMDTPILTPLDSCSGVWGLEMPERLLWEAYVVRQDIAHPPGWETGRGSEPDYMDMNLHSTRKIDTDQPRVVVYQFDEVAPLNPRGLLVAYEEHGRVQPVASDFDAFLFGSRGLEYDAVPGWQLPFLESMILHTQAVLSRPDEQSWTHRWLAVLKGQGALERDGERYESSIAGSIGQKRKDGRYGFGDQMSRTLVRELMHHSCTVESHGAVRHAAECFNYYFPQELDEEFLVLWHGYEGAPASQRRYLNPAQLRAFLLERVADGFVFPINPCWVLRDEGWFDVYEALLASPACHAAMDAWLPPSSGLRERIAAIHEAHPHGFVRLAAPGAVQPKMPRKAAWLLGSGRMAPTLHERMGEEAYERADLELRRHQTLQRARRKMRSLLVFLHLGQQPGGGVSDLTRIALKGTYSMLSALTSTLGSVENALRDGVEEIANLASEVTAATLSLGTSLTLQATQEVLQATQDVSQVGRRFARQATRRMSDVKTAPLPGSELVRQVSSQSKRISTSLVGSLGMSQ